MALRLLATIWSRGWRWGNCGSNSRQNSQGRLERVSKRWTTAGSMCSTEGGSWERRERIRPFCGASAPADLWIVDRRLDGTRLFTTRDGNCTSRLVVGCFQESRSEEHTSELQSLRHLVCRL